MRPTLVLDTMPHFIPPRVARRIAARALLALLCLPATGVAQPQGHAAPKRPTLGGGLDTNSSWNYYEFGMRVLEQDPRSAADALFWAARLDPTNGAALYARRVAFMLADPRLNLRYLRGDWKTIRSPDVQRMDTLLVKAQLMDPFLVRRLDRQLIMQAVRTITMDELRRRQLLNKISEAEIEFYLRQAVASSTPEQSGAVAMAEGRY